jgi:formate C-acetyltransferase
MVTTSTIDEVNKVIALTDRVKKRKEECRAAIPHLCAERSRLVTESWKETEGEPMVIRRAKLFKKVMKGISVVIREGELIVGSQAKYIRGAGPAVDFNPDYAFSLLETEDFKLGGGTRTGEVSEAEKASLLQDARYWKGRAPYDVILKTRREAFGKKIDDLINDIYEAMPCLGPITLPASERLSDYGKVMNKGLNGIIAEAKEGLKKLSFSVNGDIKKYYFLQAVIITCEAAIMFAHRYAELARNLAGREGDAIRKKELEKIADICEWVPANPARSFYEALQSFWFIHLTVNLESSCIGQTPGRMDQYLYPFYERDLEEGRITRQEAAELLCCLWVKFEEIEDVKGREYQQAGQLNTTNNITIGGVDKDGRDATNELTYLLLEVTRQLKTAQPLLYLRCHSGTPEELWMKAAEVDRDRGDGNPAFLNDEPVLLNFVSMGIPIQEARDWMGGGCIIPFISHASPPDRPVRFNASKVLELTLNNGVDPRTGKQVGLATGDPRDFSSFNELYDAFKKQYDFFATLLARWHRLFWQVRNDYYSLPFASALMDDCISKGMSYMEGGSRYPQRYWVLADRGHQNVADSLAAIKKLVFEEKKISMTDLLQALKVNFEGKEKLRQMLLAAPKYGNDDGYVDEIFNDLCLWTQRRLTQEKHVLGHNGAMWRGGVTVHYFFGKTVGALPDGRKAWQPLADGSLSPMQGVDVKGPTAVINSASKVNHTEVCVSSLFNMKFFPAVIRSREGIKKFIALIKTYFDRGGYHIQFNLMGQEVLLDARKHPERHRDLLVRVAGYSAYFVDLSPEVQDEIIARTEHTL